MGKLREITRGSIVPLFNDEWIYLKLNEMFVQQYHFTQTLKLKQLLEYLLSFKVTTGF